MIREAGAYEAWDVMMYLESHGGPGCFGSSHRCDVTFGHPVTGTPTCDCWYIENSWYTNENLLSLYQILLGILLVFRLVTYTAGIL